MPCDLLALLRGSLTEAIREGDVVVGNQKKGVKYLSGVDGGNLAPITDLNPTRIWQLQNSVYEILNSARSDLRLGQNSNAGCART